MDNKPYSHFDYLTSLFTESPKYFYSDCIAELWAAIPEKVYEENEPFWLIRDNHKKQIEDAIVKGELEGIIEERIEGSKDDGFEAITDKNRIRKIEKGRLGNNYVVFTVYHDKFKDWLIKSNQWPLADDCLLNKWFEGEQQTETVHAAEMANQAVDCVGIGKARKKLMPLERETTEGLLLLYEIFKSYGVEYSDDLKAITAWGKIISGEFVSEFIKEIAATKKHLVLSGGEKFDKAEFLDKWRRRFR